MADKFDEMRKLEKLLKEGVLSQEEFDKEKVKVFGENNVLEFIYEDLKGFELKDFDFEEPEDFEETED
jgi:hypothetical protein